MKNAWIVEGHAHVAANALRILNRLDFKAFHMQSELEALDAILGGATVPDVIMLGPDLPDGGHGLHVLACLNKSPRRAEVKVIFYATEPDLYSTTRAKELGADAVLQTKRFDDAIIAGTFLELKLIHH